MTLFRRFAVLGLFLFVAMPSGWAQSGSVALENGSVLSTYGYTFTISGCNWATNVSSGTAGACSSGSTNLDGLVLEAVQTGRDQISVEVASSTAGSAALSQALNGDKSYLTFSVAVATTGSTKMSGALLTAVGVYSVAGGTQTFTTQATSSNWPTTPLGPASAWASKTGVVQTKSSGQDTFASALNGFSFGESVQLQSSVTTGSVLALNTLTMKFYTTPEPASITALLVGLGGLVVARRRRRSL